MEYPEDAVINMNAERKVSISHVFFIISSIFIKICGICFETRSKRESSSIVEAHCLTSHCPPSVLHENEGEEECPSDSYRPPSHRVDGACCPIQPGYDRFTDHITSSLGYFMFIEVETL